jgi:C-terminal processing protease CtpA/Prc
MTKVTMFMTRIALFIALALVSALSVAAGPQSADEAYALLSECRDRHSDVIWDGKPADAQQLQAIVADLEAGLARMRDPLIHDLAEGSVYLRYRRYNLLVDLVKVHARRGDADAAFNAMSQLAAMDWSASMLATLEEDPFVRKLQGDSRYRSLQTVQAVMARFGHDSVLAETAAPDEASRIAGLARLWSVARDGFVWFDRIPDVDWDRRFAEYIPQVAAAQDTETYYRVLTRFVAGLRDGHSNVYAPEHLAQRFYSRPGLRTRRIEGQVIVTELSDALRNDGRIAVGDRVLAIDGVPVDDYARDRVAPYQSSSTPQDLELRTYGYALLSGPADAPVDLELERDDGRRVSVRVERSSGSTIARPPTEAFEVRTDGVAVLTLRQFETDAGSKLLEANLPRLMAAKALVIDLRGNGGGSSTHGLNVLSWLSATPVPGTASSYRENTAFAAARSGTPRIRWRELPAETFGGNRPQVFIKPVAMLVDAGTFSAAEDTAAAFKLMKRGPIIGEPTGGSTGQPYLFPLPGGGSARICVKRDSYPDGSHFVGVGIQPDVVLRRTVRQVREQQDLVLEQAVGRLLRGSS